MKIAASKAANLNDAATPPQKAEARWPLSYKIIPPPQQGLEAFGVSTTSGKPKKRWWSHLLYRGPNNERVKILYSKTKAESEVLAKHFLEEKVVGFDMEWPWDDWKRPDNLQNKIGLIQVAAEDRVALFHIGLHTGTTTEDIVAPSLRKLIESPSIGKIGVGVLNADFVRLSKYFKLQPKGAIELSHLHRLVTFGGRKPEMVSTKMTSLAHQVEQHLEHPLYKGDVRTSNWSKPLSEEQIKYAAGDAYAGFMLYHCLNYKRLKMVPTPPLPIHADKYLGYNLPKVGPLYLEPLESGGKVMTSAFFFGVPTAPEDLSSRSKRATTTSSTNINPAAQSEATTTRNDPNAAKQPRVRRTAARPDSLESLDSSSRALFEELSKWRTGVATRSNLPGYRILADKSLEELAKQRPLNTESILKIKGIGPKKAGEYGGQLILVISAFLASNSTVVLDGVADEPPKSVCSAAPDRGSRRKARPKTPESSPAFATPPPPHTPSLHTGLSFTLAGTILAEHEDSDDSLPSLDFGLTPSRRVSGQKRKRNESPAKRITPDSSQKLQERIQNFRYNESVSERQVLKTPLKKPSPTHMSIQRVSSCVATRASDPPMQISTSPAPLTPESRIFRNKLVAFSRLVASKASTNAEDLVSNAVLEGIARKPPQTQDELRAIPGVEKLFLACVDANMDLLAKIQRFAPAGMMATTLTARGNGPVVHLH